MPANPIGRALRNRHAGHHTLVWARPDMKAPESFTLTSPSFDHRTPIPERHRGKLFGANISPALAWTTPPADTAELVLIVQDPDVPLKKPATHALTIGIDPSLTGIPENGLTDPSPIPGIKHGKGALDKQKRRICSAGRGEVGFTRKQSQDSSPAGLVPASAVPTSRPVLSHDRPDGGTTASFRAHGSLLGRVPCLTVAALGW